MYVPVRHNFFILLLICIASQSHHTAGGISEKSSLLSYNGFVHHSREYFINQVSKRGLLTALHLCSPRESQKKRGSADWLMNNER